MKKLKTLLLLRLKTSCFDLMQGVLTLQDSTSRIFMSCYWILTVTITAVFIGNLTAFMTMKKLRLPVNTLEELAARPDYQAGFAGGTATRELFKVTPPIQWKIFDLRPKTFAEETRLSFSHVHLRSCEDIPQKVPFSHNLSFNLENLQMPNSSVYKKVWDTNVNVNPENLYNANNFESCFTWAQKENFVCIASVRN